MTEATETKPDTRVKVAGHPLPWDCGHCEENGDLLFIDDADGKAVFANLDHRQRDAEGEPIVPDSFFARLVRDVNRMGEVQANLAGLTSLTIDEVTTWVIPDRSGALVYPKVKSTPQMADAASMFVDEVDETPAWAPTGWTPLTNRELDKHASRIAEEHVAIAGAPWDEVQAHTEPLARISALETALVEVVNRFTVAGRCHMDYAMANLEARETLRSLGLAHRLSGNLAEAEEAMS